MDNIEKTIAIINQMSDDGVIENTLSAARRRLSSTPSRLPPKTLMSSFTSAATDKAF